MTDNQCDEMIGADGSPVANDITVRFEVKATCRCCGTTVSTAEHEILFGSYLPFENILRCLETEDIDRSTRQLLQQGANASSAQSRRSRGEGA